MGKHQHFPQHVRRRAEQIQQALSNGIHWSHFHGKRLNCDRDFVSIPLPSFYRLVLWLTDGGEPCKSLVLSHEQYNSMAKRIRR